MTHRDPRKRTEAERAAHIKALVDAAPPLSPEQIDRLRVILASAVSRAA